MSYGTHVKSPRAALLSADEEQRLAQVIEDGREAAARLEGGSWSADDERLIAAAARARRRFIESNIRLVLSMANAFRVPTHVDRDDVVQDGMLGLETAVERFDWRKGYKFSTYATWWIRQSMQRGLENTASTIRIPAHRYGEVQTALAHVSGDYARLPGPLAKVAAISSLDSIDRAVTERGDTIADLTSSQDLEPEDHVEHSHEIESIRRLVESLDPLTARVIVARFGLDGSDALTYRELANDMGVSQEAVRRRVTRALAAMRPEAEALAA